MDAIKALLLYLLVLNLTGFVFMGQDKRRAQLGARRISERRLLLTAALGGSLGVLAGMYSWHHKTRKKKFTRGVPAILGLQLLAAAAIWWMLIKNA